MTSQVEDVLVIGGGIGGLSTALAVARHGRRVRVVEQAARFAEIGAGLQLGPNAMRSFDRLGVLGRVLDAAVLPREASSATRSPARFSPCAARLLSYVV